MIGIEAGHSLDRPPTGVAVYARNLIWELARLQPSCRFRWFYRSNRYFRSFRDPLPANAGRMLLEGPWRSRATGGLRLFHGLNQRLPEGLRCPTVATFHDLFALTGEYSAAEYRDRFAGLARETAGRADRIIAVSSYTAGRVEEILRFPRSLITVVHHGVELQNVPPAARREAVLRGLGVSRPFLLHIGALQVRKNVERIVAAFEAAGGSTGLVLAGAPGYGADRILARIDRSTARDRIRTVGHVGNEARASLYGSAEALLFPSLEEGFGLPVIEAFSAGLPVVASNVSAIPEVAGDAAVLVDPLSADEIAGALERVLASGTLRAELRAKGFARAKEFTWRRCAEQTWAAYATHSLSR